jgi:hypothetical protein
MRTPLLLLAFAAIFAAARAQSPQETQEFVQSTEALALQPRSAAYGRFIDLYLISAPHADKGIQGFIDRARKGDKDAFAFVSFMIWQGYAGFRSNQLNAKLALTSAMKDGSATAAYFLGETFVQAATRSDAERAERYADSLHWYGMAAGMGEARGHDRAMEIIKTLAPINQDHRRVFMGLYNSGLEQGVQAKRAVAK